MKVRKSLISEGYKKYVEASFIEAFDLNGVAYMHHIFCSEDDRVELSDEDNNVLLTYTANCYVFDKDKKHVAYVSMDKNYCWYFKTDNEEYAFGMRDLLKAEVEFSKLYIQGAIK